jgi:hypothetical protein
MTAWLKLVKNCNSLGRRRVSMSMRKRFITAILAGLMLTGCATTRIGRINADPSRYQNRDVRVEGNVVSSFGALGAGGYQIDDGTGKIYVISTGSGVPSKGSRVEVNGTVTGGATVFGKSYGTAIREHGHKVRR